MDDITIEPTLQDIFNAIGELRHDMSRHEQLLQKILGELQLDKNDYWVPSRAYNDVLEPIRVSTNIRSIQSLEINAGDIRAKLRDSQFGKFYVKHLKSSAIIRWVVQCAWRNGYPIYVNHISTHFGKGKTKKWRPLITLKEFIKKENAVTYTLADTVIVETPVPKVFPAYDQDYLQSPHDQYQFPEIIVTNISDGTIYGGTNLIVKDNDVICHDLYDFERDYTSEELHGRAVIDPKSKRIRWMLSDTSPESIAIAATFVDACAANYAHWITEVLPRIALFCANDRFKDVSIVINAGLHKNIMESLLLIAGAEREIIMLPIGRALVVKELFVTSVAGYVPFERRNNKLLNHSHGLFSPQAFEIIRDRLLAVTKQLPVEEYPQNIYIRRGIGPRAVVNGPEIERLLMASGFVIVQPDKLSFVEQVNLFANARVVIASSGAALANMIFCPPNTKISIFISKYPNTSYWYWQNMAAASGNYVRYFLGEPVEGAGHGIHSDFSISLKEIVKTLSPKSES